MIKVVTVVGARPQFIKASVVSRAFQQHRNKLNEVIIHTGQHFDANMSEIFFDELGIPTPDYNLGVGGGSHGQNTGRMLESIESTLIKEKADWVLVYGDTDSTLAGALAASKLHIPIAHIEAGLRSYNRKMPEEINRILTDHISDLLFTPTQLAVENLGSEGIQGNLIHNIGDVMYDATLYYSELAKSKSTLLQKLGFQEKEYILVTIHRAENTDDPKQLSNIIEALLEVSEKNKIILPVHPRTKIKLEQLDLLDQCQKFFTLIEPVGYLDMLMLEKGANVIVTDSGGVQKEAYFQKVPCITLRDETEWVELIENNVNTLVEHDNIKNLPSVINSMLENTLDYSQNLYGFGDSSQKIANILANAK